MRIIFLWVKTLDTAVLIQKLLVKEIKLQVDGKLKMLLLTHLCTSPNY